MMDSEQLPSLNMHIREGIEYYTSLNIEDGPGYAILISGDWGTGKTHTIRAILKALDVKHVWVSLYGLNETSQINDAIFAEINPILSSKKFKLAAKVGKGFLKGALKIDLDGDGSSDATASADLSNLNLEKIADPEKSQLLIFDDLERSNFKKPEQILGYINSFVELNGLKAIIIGNDSKLVKRHKQYKDIKEKLIGKTYEIEPDVTNAVSAIYSDLEEEVTKFLAPRTDLIKSFCLTFSKQKHREDTNQGDQKNKGQEDWEDINFRCLKRALIDFQHLYRNLDSTLREKEEKLADFFKLFLLLGYFSKTGKLDSAELDQLKTTEYEFRLKNEDLPLVYRLLNAWDFKADIHELYVGVEEWKHALLKGNQAGFVKSLKKSTAFRPTPAEDSWVTVWHGIGHEQEVFEEAVTTLEQEIAERKYKTREEVLHLIGISIWLREDVYANSGNESSAQQSRHDTWTKISRDWQVYIKDIESHLKISLKEHYFRDREDGKFGLSIWRGETEEFQELSNHLYSVSQQGLYSSIASTVYELAKQIPETYVPFYNAVCATNNPGDSYPSIPVLHNFDPNEFTSILFSTPAEHFSDALMFFKTRYEFHYLSKLEPEYEWFCKVVELLEAERDASEGIDHYRQKNAMELYVDPAIRAWDTYFQSKSDQDPASSAG